MLFLYKKIVQKNKFAYLPTLKNIGTFLETRHCSFCIILHEINAYTNYGEKLSIFSHVIEQKQNFRHFKIKGHNCVMNSQKNCA